MLTDEDVQKIINAQREVFATKTDFADFRDELRNNYSNLLTAVDTYGSNADKYFVGS